MTTTLDNRLRAICDLSLPAARECGRHEYDGMIQDLSAAGVRVGLDRLGGDPYDDPHDDAHAAAAEESLRVRLGELELHRRNPLYHLDNLDVSAETPTAVRSHLRHWPEAVGIAVETLDRVPAALAEATLPMAVGLSADLDHADEETRTIAQAAVDRLVAHLRRAAEEVSDSPALGGPALSRMMSASEACTVDLATLYDATASECERWSQRLREACRRVDPDAPLAAVVAGLRADRPRDDDDLLARTRKLVDEVRAWTERTGLAPYHDGECRVALTPPSQRRAAAGMFGTDTPSWFFVTPPDNAWDQAERDDWYGSYFNRSNLANIAIHEVAPGHFSHFRAIRRLASPVRQTLVGDVFHEGWAHYVEEIALDEGFHADDPGHEIAVALDALRRTARLACAIGLHSGWMTIDDAIACFEKDALITGAAARAEAVRGLYDPTYGRYTWGKLAILDARERARTAWGSGFSLQRFHAALLALGSPPIGLLDTAIERG